ncbi:LXG domain-containing protein [Fictibacillus sp. Mic-4]|uniref:ribonuclease YeeF family protein n=1 Tax=Fictibacillus TaxID=1329200 RepID=UPI0003FCC159|nr:LXG domain-containing protein [Fictibacillus gelatini]
MKVLDVKAFTESISDTEKYLESLSEQIKQTKDAIKGIISLEDSLKGKAGQAIRSFYQECHLSFLLYFESFIEDYKAILNSIKTQLKNFEPDPNGFISESFLDDDVKSGLNKIERTTISIVNEANEAMKKVLDIIDLPDLDETEVVESIWKAKRHSKNTIEQLYAFDKAQTSALETVEKDLAVMVNYIKQIDSAIRTGEVGISNYSVKQITSYDTYNELIANLAQKTNPYENSYRRPDVDEQLEAASYIENIQDRDLTKEEYETLEDKKVLTVPVIDVYSEFHGDYHIYANGIIVRDYYDNHFKRKFEIVDEIPEQRVETGRILDSPFEGTPLEILDYVTLGTLIKKGATHLAKDVAKGLGKKIEKKYASKVVEKNTKIIYPNKPHTNKTPGHWEAMVEKAEELAKREDVRRVYLNKGLSNEIPGIKPNRRPDIMVVRKDGKIDQYEVPSKSDNIEDLLERMEDNKRLLGDAAGDIFILPIKK